MADAWVVDKCFCLTAKNNKQRNLLTSSLIRPSYPFSAQPIIFFSVFPPKMSNLTYLPAQRVKNLLWQTCNLNFPFWFHFILNFKKNFTRLGQALGWQKNSKYGYKPQIRAYSKANIRAVPIVEAQSLWTPSWYRKKFQRKWDKKTVSKHQT